MTYCQGSDRIDYSSPRAVSPQSSHVFYINRVQDTGRREAIETQLDEVGLIGERFPAIEGLALPKHLQPQFFTGGELHSKLRPGEVGCYASHLEVLRLIVERDLPHALILEDDANLLRDFVANLSDVIDSLPQNWDLVHLCRMPSRAIKMIRDVNDKHKLVRYSRVPDTTTCYLISRAGARKFLVAQRRYWPIDTDYRRPWHFGLDVYGVVPRLASVDIRFPSSIHAMGDHSRMRRGFPMPSLRCWTGNPLRTPYGIGFNILKLGPVDWCRCLFANAPRWWHSLIFRRRLKRHRDAANT